MAKRGKLDTVESSWERFEASRSDLGDLTVHERAQVAHAAGFADGFGSALAGRLLVFRATFGGVYLGGSAIVFARTRAAASRMARAAGEKRGGGEGQAFKPEWVEVEELPTDLPRVAAVEDGDY